MRLSIESQYIIEQNIQGQSRGFFTGVVVRKLAGILYQRISPSPLNGVAQKCPHIMVSISWKINLNICFLNTTVNLQNAFQQG